MIPHGGGDIMEDAGMAEEQYSYIGDQGMQLPAQGTVLDACYTLTGDVMTTASVELVQNQEVGCVQVWGAEQNGWRLLHTTKLQGKPTQLAWAHPQHGQLLAVGTSNGRLHVIQGPLPASSSSSSRHAGQQGEAKQQEQQQEADWRSIAQLQCGKGPVSALAFAPHQHGLILAAACSRQHTPAGASSRVTGSGYVQLWEADRKASRCSQWTLVSKIELAEAAGSCQCLCWHEPTPGLPPLLLGGHDKGGSIWGYNSPTMMWQELASFAAPAGAGPTAVSAHWAPALGRPYELIAASFGKAVVLYKVQQASGSKPPAGLEQQRQLGQLEVVSMQQLSHPEPVWKLEFNMMGTTLACSLDGRPEVWLWMPLMDGTWAAVSKIGGQQRQGSIRAADDGVMVD